MTSSPACSEVTQRFREQEAVVVAEGPTES